MDSYTNLIVRIDPNVEFFKDLWCLYNRFLDNTSDIENFNKSSTLKNDS